MTRRLVSMGVFLAISAGGTPGSWAQLQSNAGKSWRIGTSSASQFVQVTVTQGSSTQIAGTVSFRNYGLWQGAKVKQFSGTQRTIGNLKRFDCTCEDGMTFHGWYWPGPTGSRGDDRIAIYFRTMARPTEFDNPCFPDQDMLVLECDREQVE